MTTQSKDWLILNAVLAYLHHYPNNTHTEDYKKLKDEPESKILEIQKDNQIEEEKRNSPPGTEPLIFR